MNSTISFAAPNPIPAAAQMVSSPAVGATGPNRRSEARSPCQHTHVVTPNP